MIQSHTLNIPVGKQWHLSPTKRHCYWNPFIACNYFNKADRNMMIHIMSNILETCIDSTPIVGLKSCSLQNVLRIIYLTVTQSLPQRFLYSTLTFNRHKFLLHPYLVFTSSLQYVTGFICLLIGLQNKTIRNVIYFNFKIAQKAKHTNWSKFWI